MLKGIQLWLRWRTLSALEVLDATASMSLAVLQSLETKLNDSLLGDRSNEDG